jgi:cell division protease FtsH
MHVSKLPKPEHAGQGYSFRCLDDLREILPHVARAWGLCASQICVCEDGLLPKDYMRSALHRDHPVATCGLVGLPYIVSHRLHEPVGFPFGTGLVYFAARHQPALQYAIFMTRNALGGQWHFLLVPKNRLYRLARHMHRSDRAASCPIKPMLAEGMLDRIWRNSLYFLKQSNQLQKFGVRVRRGLLLSGPPGNGKTMVCRWFKELCRQAGVAYGMVNSGDIEKSYRDGSLPRLLRSWKVMFFDDIDAGYFTRSGPNAPISSALLSAMDGVQDDGLSIRFFTTNESAGLLDKAFCRPGRIDCLFYLDNPDGVLRRRFFQGWPESIRRHVDLERLADETEHYSFADLDEIKTLLVTRHLLSGNGTWDWEEALREFRRRNETTQHNEKTAGFVVTDQERTARFQLASDGTLR